MYVNFNNDLQFRWFVIGNDFLSPNFCFFICTMSEFARNLKLGKMAV
jgi:hypothetical protein